MKDSSRAAWDEDSHRRCVEALKNIPGANKESVKALEDARSGRKSPAVRMAFERAAMADILEGLSSSKKPRKKEE